MNSRFLIGAIGLVLGVAMADGIGAEHPATPPATQDNSVQPGTDAWITTKVKAELTATKEVPGNAIAVSTINGVVTLAGIVDNKEQVQKSIALAKGIKGVRDVDSTALNSHGN